VFLEESTRRVVVVFGTEVGADAVGCLLDDRGEVGLGCVVLLVVLLLWVVVVVAVVWAAVQALIVPVQVVLCKVWVLGHEAPECVCGWPQGGAREKKQHKKRRVEGKRRRGVKMDTQCCICE